MCDYSLMAIPNRLAAEGEELVAHRFPTGSMGLASPADLRKRCNAPQAQRKTVRSVLELFFSPRPADPVPAVCIPPGSRLMLHDLSERLQRDLKVGPKEEVVFLQISAMENTYRDAVRFRNGRDLRLQELHEGQRVDVLDLGVETREAVLEEARHF